MQTKPDALLMIRSKRSQFLRISNYASKEGLTVLQIYVNSNTLLQTTSLCSGASVVSTISSKVINNTHTVVVSSHRKAECVGTENNNMVASVWWGGLVHYNHCSIWCISTTNCKTLHQSFYTTKTTSGEQTQRQRIVTNRNSVCGAML